MLKHRAQKWAAQVMKVASQVATARASRCHSKSLAPPAFSQVPKNAYGTSATAQVWGFEKYGLSRRPGVGMGVLENSSILEYLDRPTINVCKGYW